MGTWQCVSCAVYTESHVCMLNQSVTRIPLWCFSRSWRFEQRKREKEKLGSAVTGVGSEAHLPSFGSKSVLKRLFKTGWGSRGFMGMGNDFVIIFK